MPKYNTVEEVRDFAFDCHRSVNQKYDGDEYSVHLEEVVAVAKLFIHLIPEKDRDTVIKVCYCHDILEDVHHKSYNDLNDLVGYEVAESSHALATEKGKTRAERANDKYYQGILETPYAVFGKLCDRGGNMKHSKERGGSMYQKYKKEFPHFKEKLYTPEYKEVWDYLESI